MFSYIFIFLKFFYTNFFFKLKNSKIKIFIFKPLEYLLNNQIFQSFSFYKSI